MVLWKKLLVIVLIILLVVLAVFGFTLLVLGILIAFYVFTRKRGRSCDDGLSDLLVGKTNSVDYPFETCKERLPEYIGLLTNLDGIITSLEMIIDSSETPQYKRERAKKQLNIFKEMRNEIGETLGILKSITKNVTEGLTMERARELRDLLSKLEIPKKYDLIITRRTTLSKNIDKWIINNTNI